MEFSHTSVLLEETIEALHIRPDGTYVDCTAGGGGHSAAILERLQNGRLFCLDQDPDAIAALHERFDGDSRVTVIQTNFDALQTVLAQREVFAADGVLADLGVSSHQLDTAERGFSFHNDAPLDMRMSQSGPTAADLVNTLPERELSSILWRFGEEKCAASIARNIVKARAQQPIESTLALAEIVKYSIPAKLRRTGGHPARRTFQALRIAVNAELDRLETSVDQMFDLLSPGGRLCIITFHSLEDRIVKTKYAAWLQGCTCPPEFPVCVCGKTPRGKRAGKPIAPSPQELERNARARSAKLRVIEKN